MQIAAIDVKVILNALEVTVDPILRKHLSMALRRATKLYTQNIIKLPSNENRLTDKEIEAGRFDGKIPCIKLVRERTSLGLKETKDLVEAEFIRLDYAFNNSIIPE